MAVTLDTDVGSSTANSYVSAADADAYVESHMLDPDQRGEWEGLPDDDKARYLILATKRLDMYTGWKGYRAQGTQALEWPRAYVVDEDGYTLPSHEIPQKIIEATVETAWWLWQNEGTTPVEAYQYDAIRVGPISVNFNERAGGPAKSRLPDHVLALISGLGSFSGPSGQGNTVQQVKMVRG